MSQDISLQKSQTKISQQKLIEIVDAYKKIREVLLDISPEAIQKDCLSCANYRCEGTKPQCGLMPLDDPKNDIPKDVLHKGCASYRYDAEFTPF